MDATHIIEIIVSAITGGGLVTLFTAPEKKASARLDNAERVIKKFEEIAQRLEDENEEKDEQIKELTKKVNQQAAMIEELKTKLKTCTLVNQEDRLLRCEVMGCKKRRPKLDRSQLAAMK